jgi:hypothetical protein
LGLRLFSYLAKNISARHSCAELVGETAFIADKNWFDFPQSSKKKGLTGGKF